MTSLARLVAVAATLLAVLVGTTLPAAPAIASTNGVMVSFGDSVPSGARCACTAFPTQYAALVARHTGRAVRMTNDAVGGATSASVLQQLQTMSVRSAVHASGTVLVMVGANDFVTPFRRVLHHQEEARAAFRPVAAVVRRHVAELVRELHALRPGIRVLVGNYWNVVKDGRVARQQYGAWGLAKANEATRYANRALARAARENGATLISTYVPFKGEHGHRDPTALLAADGDHPNARGHAVIAEAYFRAALAG